MTKKSGWNADEMQGSLISDMEQEVKNGYQKIGQGGGEETKEVTVPTVTQASTASSVRNDEPTKGVQANLPISLYNRMKKLKFETDESFQSMFQRAMDIFLDIEEGKMKVTKSPEL